jgi:hypothetical protein
MTAAPYELFAAPLFNYWAFYNSGLFSDCKIEIEEVENGPVATFDAHRIILANGCELLKEVLTDTKNWGDVQGGVVHWKRETTVPEIFRIVIEFLYTGVLKVEHKTIMRLVHFATHLTPEFHDVIIQERDARCQDRRIVYLIDECYENELEIELAQLVAPIARAWVNGILDIRTLSDSLDVVTFARVVQEARALRPELFEWERLAEYIFAFLQDSSGAVWVLDDPQRDGALAKGPITETSALEELFKGIQRADRVKLEKRKAGAHDIWTPPR